MPMNFLVWQALETSDTSYVEGGRGASLLRQQGEIILVFHTDTEEFRRWSGVETVCDALFLYKKPPDRPVLLFVEIKGTDVDHAATQIRVTLGVIHSRLRGALKQLDHANAELRAVIVATGTGAPRDFDRIRREFERETQVTLKVVTVKKGNCDLRKFL